MRSPNKTKTLDKEMIAWVYRNGFRRTFFFRLVQIAEEELKTKRRKLYPKLLDDISSYLNDSIICALSNDSDFDYHDQSSSEINKGFDRFPKVDA